MFNFVLTLSTPRIFGAGALLAALTVLPGANGARAAEPTEAVVPADAPVAATIPPVPTIPASLTFEQELAGRRALFTARDACRTAPTLRFAATWKIATQNGGADKKIAVYNGTETLAHDARGRRLNLSTETVANGGKTVRRAISNGDTLLVTRFEQKNAKAAPTREAFRLPFGPDDALVTTLYQAQVTPITRAAGWAFDSAWTVKGRTWRDAKPVTGGGTVAAHAVYEAETPTGDVESGRGRTARTRRYIVADKTGLPLVFEEWTVIRAAPRPNDNGNGSRVTYRREDYRNVQTGARLPAALWAQAVPAGYAEKALPNVPLPGEAGGPQDGDAQALALLARWSRAHERMLSYTADVTLTVQQTTKTPDAPTLPVEWRDQSIAYTVWLKRPGNARLTLNAVNAAAARTAAAMGQRQNGNGGGRRNNQNRYNQSLLAVADGATAFGLDRTARQGRSVVLDNPDNLGQRLMQAGWNDWAGTLNWLLASPRAVYQNADRVTYAGKTDVDGEPVEAVRIESTTDGNGNRRRRGRDAGGGAQITTTITVYLGADGLPRATETFRSTNIEGMYDRDEPPNLSLIARYRDARADVPPPSSAFTLTVQDAALIRPRGR